MADVSLMGRRRYHNDCVFLRGKNPVWVGRHREDAIGTDGHPVRVLKSIVLGTKKGTADEAFGREAHGNGTVEDQRTFVQNRGYSLAETRTGKQQPK